MALIGHGVEICTYATRPATAALGTIIYQTDTDEYLKYVSYGGANRWMQVDHPSNRNAIANGEFRIWQRGTSVSNMTSSRAAAYSADRWESYRGSYDTGITISRQTGTGQFAYCARVQRVNGNASGTYLFLNQPVESVDSKRFAGKWVTLSYWARAGSGFQPNVANRLIAQVSTGTGSDQNFRGGFSGNAAPAYHEISLSTNWAYYSVSGQASASLNQVGVQFYHVPTGTAGANDWFEVTGVQLEVGSAPSEFEFVDYASDLQRCQRFYQAYSGVYCAPGYDDDYGRQVASIYFPVSMRNSPDIGVTAGGMDGHHGTAPAGYNSGPNHATFNWSGGGIRAPSAASWVSFYASADL